MSQPTVEELLAGSQELLDSRVLALLRGQGSMTEPQREECLLLAQTSTLLALQALMVNNGKTGTPVLRFLVAEVAVGFPDIWSELEDDLLAVRQSERKFSEVGSKLDVIRVSAASSRVLSLIARNVNRPQFKPTAIRFLEETLESNGNVATPLQLLISSQHILDVEVPSVIKRAQDFEEDSDYDDCLDLVKKATRQCLQALLEANGQRYSNDLFALQSEVSTALPNLWNALRSDVSNIGGSELSGDGIDRERHLLRIIVSACRVVTVVANLSSQSGCMPRQTEAYESRLEYLERD